MAYNLKQVQNKTNQYLPVLTAGEARETFEPLRLGYTFRGEWVA